MVKVKLKNNSSFNKRFKVGSKPVSIPPFSSVEIVCSDSDYKVLCDVLGVSHLSLSEPDTASISNNIEHKEVVKESEPEIVEAPKPEENQDKVVEKKPTAKVNYSSMSLEELKDAYKRVFGKKASGNVKRETLIKALEEKA